MKLKKCLLNKSLLNRSLLNKSFLKSAVVASALVWAAAIAGQPDSAGPAPPSDALPSDSVYQLQLPLVDQNGRRSDWGVRRGKPQLVSMFYTSCQYICPLIVDSGKAIERHLTPAQQQRLGILLISMDPAHDSPSALKTVVVTRGLDAKRWTLAAPPADQVSTVAGVLGIRYRQLADGEFNHTSAMILLDADGRIIARTDRMGTQPDPAFIAIVRKATSGRD